MIERQEYLRWHCRQGGEQNENNWIYNKKNELWISVLEGSSKETCILKTTEKFRFQADTECSQLMNEFFNIFTEIIEKYNPNKIVYKLFLDSKKSQIEYMVYPWGILNYICADKDITISSFTGAWFSASKNGKKKTKCCQEYFEQKSFNADELVATTAAWYGFE